MVLLMPYCGIQTRYNKDFFYVLVVFLKMGA